MSKKTPEQLVQEASAWWSTGIVDIHPGEIRFRGYPIQDLIGEVRFPDMIWLMLRGELPTRAQGDLLEAALVASVDHGPQAPSIAIARMAVTCGLPLNGAMASGINALDDIHGGAGQQCMQIYQQIAALIDQGTELGTAVDTVLDGFTAEHGKIIPGFGHRFHPTDPRTPKLLQLIENARMQGVIDGRYARVGIAVEAALARRAGKRIPMNIDGVTAVIFSELGFAAELGRGLFILSRAVGILSHAWEQKQQGGRIKGPMPKDIPYTYTGAGERRLSPGSRSTG
jgi:citrate synthase